MRGFGRGVRYGFYGELVTPGEILEGPSGLTSHPVPQTCEGLPCSEALGPGPERGKERLVLVLSPDPPPPEDRVREQQGDYVGGKGGAGGWSRVPREQDFFGAQSGVSTGVGGLGFVSTRKHREKEPLEGQHLLAPGA